MNPSAIPPRAEPTTQIRHTCLILEEEEAGPALEVIDQIALSAAQGWRVLFFSKENMLEADGLVKRLEQLRARLGEQTPGLANLDARGQVQVLSSACLPQPDQQEWPGALVDWVTGLTRQALADGWKGLLLTGEPGWPAANLATGAQFLALEAAFSALPAKLPVRVICPYIRSSLTQEELLGILSVHPTVQINRQVQPQPQTAVQAPSEGLSADQQSARWLSELAAGQGQTQAEPALPYDREAAEEALSISEARYRLFFDSASDAILITQLDGRILEANQVSVDRLGYSRAELLTMTPMDISSPDQAERFLERLKQAHNQGRLVYETMHVSRSGRQIPTEVNSRLIHFDGRLAVFSIARDISDQVEAKRDLSEYRRDLERMVDQRTRELRLTNQSLEQEISRRKKIEADLRESEERYRVLINHAPSCVWVIQDGHYVFSNPAGAEMLGYPDPEALVQTPVMDTISPEMHETIQKRMQSLQKGTRNPAMVLPMRRLDGSEMILQALSIPINYQGNPAGLVIGNDVTDQLRAEERIRMQARLLDSVGEAVVAFNTDDKIMYLNRSAEELYGWSLTEATGKSFRHVIPENGTREQLEDILQRVKEGEIWSGEMLLIRRDSSLFPALITISPILNPAGVIEGTVTVSQDITERIHAEEQLRSSLAEKEVMLREIHHRVKNNLNVMIALIGLQAETTSDAAVLTMFKELQSRVRTMALVHESLYESPSLNEVDISGYLEALITSLVASYSIDPTIRVERDVQAIPMSITTAIPCGLIINELVTNALKYAFPQPRFSDNVPCIQVSLRLVDRHYIIKIVDNGTGIPDSVSWMEPATLGLQLVRILTNQLGGKLHLDRSSGTAIQISFRERNRG